MPNATAGHVVDVDTEGGVVTVVATVVSEIVVVVVVVVDSIVVRGVSRIRGIEVVGTGASFGQNCELNPHS